MCSPSVVPLAVTTCMYGCTEFGMGSLSDASNVQEPTCLGVHTEHVRVVLGMDSLGDAPIVRRPACLGAHAVRVHVQCTAWTAWVACVVYMSAYSCTYALCLYLYSISHGQPG